MYGQQKAEEVTASCWASSDVNGATEPMVHMTGPQNRVRDGHLVLKSRDSVTQAVDKDGATAGMDLGILKWDWACRLRCWGSQVQGLGRV